MTCTITRERIALVGHSVVINFCKFWNPHFLISYKIHFFSKRILKICIEMISKKFILFSWTQLAYDRSYLTIYDALYGSYKIHVFKSLLIHVDFIFIIIIFYAPANLVSLFFLINSWVDFILKIKHKTLEMYIYVLKL